MRLAFLLAFLSSCTCDAAFRLNCARDADCGVDTGSGLPELCLNSVCTVAAEGQAGEGEGDAGEGEGGEGEGDAAEGEGDAGEGEGDAGEGEGDAGEGEGEGEGEGDVSLFPYTPSHFDPSTLTRSPAVELSCGATTLDVDTGVFTPACGVGTLPVSLIAAVGRPQLAVIALDGLRVDGGTELTLSGTSIAVIAVFGDARIDGVITASAHGAQSGPGVDLATCGEQAGGAGNTNGDTGTGGGGGGFGSGGAHGGNAGDFNGPGAAGGASDGSLVVMRAGCPGGTGGRTTGRGGGGGGGVQLSVSGLLDVRGAIRAGGGGGLGAPADKTGGSGGGSGGSIFLEAFDMNLDGASALRADGGGGGEGGDDTSSGNVGGNGEDGDASLIGTNAARGGSNGTFNGGNGGAGAFGGSAAVVGDTGTLGNGNGGGGGGGGAGVIDLRATSSCTSGNGFVVTPPAAVLGVGCS